MFITFEGVEGSGKSLQIARAEAYLASMGVRCLVTREPGGTAFGVGVRRILLETGGAPRAPLSELLLYLADRCQHLREVIEPALALGITVLSDRYHDATLAYQGAARGIPRSTIDLIAKAIGIRVPDATALLDLDPEIGLRRARVRNATSPGVQEGRFEEEALPFHRAVREAYLELARAAPGRICVVDASGAPDDVFGRIRPFLNMWVEHGR